jgi:hypothetical protein
MDEDEEDEDGDLPISAARIGELAARATKWTKDMEGEALLLKKVEKYMRKMEEKVKAVGVVLQIQFFTRFG